MADDTPPRQRRFPLRVWLELDLEAEPIEGRLRAPNAAPTEFTGWLGLSSVLDALRPEPQKPGREDANRP